VLSIFWNGDKLDGTGPSGYYLNLARVQIFWSDIEWLGVGNVRCGFVINGEFIICHTFQCANQAGNTKVYMETAILPVRYEIENTDTTADASTLKQICSTVISEGGYQQMYKILYCKKNCDTWNNFNYIFTYCYLCDLNQQEQVLLYY
jgi:hypothetical protein